MVHNRKDRQRHTKGRAIVESEVLTAFCQTKLGLESLNLSPVLEGVLLCLGKVDAHLG